MRLQIDPSIPHSLLGTKGALRQIVINLLGNAVKYTPAEPLHSMRNIVTVSSWSQSQTQDVA